VTAGLDQAVLAELDGMLAGTDADQRRLYPGDGAARQPVHTVYVPANRYDAGTVAGWGAAAAALLAEHAPDPAILAAALGMPADAVSGTLPLVSGKLAGEPIEDLRVDFEDGLPRCPDSEEDELAAAAGRSMAAAQARGEGPPYVGIRFKSFEPATRARGVRTLDRFLRGLLAAGPLPDRLVVTLPKVTAVAQVEAMVRLCERLESGYRLPAGRLRFEVQVEMPQAIVGPDGTATVARMVHVAVGRLTGLHFGTYDYTAACGVAAGYQSLEHAAADHAKAVLQVAAAGTGVRVVDGSVNVLPVGDTQAVHSSWALHARLVRRSLERGFYQGWDLHPGQLPTRFLATYAFFRAGLAGAGTRLAGYATGGSGGVQDEPATAQALASFLLRGLDCGAFTDEDVRRAAGTDRAGLHRYARRAAPE
jgi:citrate lyase beta subunit